VNNYVEITRRDDDRMLVWGWASVAETADGAPIKDAHGSIIKPDVLQNAAHNFVLDFRQAGDMHKVTQGIGQLVECVVTTRETQKAMGLSEGALPVGMWVGFKINSPSVWAMIKAKKYKAFSIGGYGRTVDI